ncbi:MAG: hypothetical protein KDI07_10050, partial [Anaerolineae bacterium]|nr:hypothetical protein [Anaerolineae bacterium]
DDSLRATGCQVATVQCVDFDRAAAWPGTVWRPARAVGMESIRGADHFANTVSPSFCDQHIYHFVICFYKI